MLTAEYY